MDRGRSGSRRNGVGDSDWSHCRDGRTKMSQQNNRELLPFVSQERKRTTEAKNCIWPRVKGMEVILARVSTAAI